MRVDLGGEVIFFFIEQKGEGLFPRLPKAGAVMKPLIHCRKRVVNNVLLDTMTIDAWHWIDFEFIFVEQRNTVRI